MKREIISRKSAGLCLLLTACIYAVGACATVPEGSTEDTEVPGQRVSKDEQELARMILADQARHDPLMNYYPAPPFFAGIITGDPVWPDSVQQLRTFFYAFGRERADFSTVAEVSTLQETIDMQAGLPPQVLPGAFLYQVFPCISPVHVVVEPGVHEELTGNSVGAAWYWYPTWLGPVLSMANPQTRSAVDFADFNQHLYRDTVPLAVTVRGQNELLARRILGVVFWRVGGRIGVSFQPYPARVFILLPDTSFLFRGAVYRVSSVGEKDVVLDGEVVVESEEFIRAAAE